jgi:ATP-binding cassette subfamily B protein
LAAGFLFVSLSNYFGILIPKKIGESLDFVKDELASMPQGFELSGIPSSLNKTLLIFAATVIGFVLLKGFFMYMMRQTIIVVSRLIEYDIRKDIYGHLLSLDTHYYKVNKTGDLMSRIAEDVSKVRNYLGPGILYAINLLTLFVFTIYSMLSVSPMLTLYTLLPLPLLSISIYYVSAKINQKSTIIQQQLAKLTVISQEVYSGIRVVKSYGKESQFESYFNDESETFRLKSLELAKINALFFPLMVLLINISTLIVLLIGGRYVFDGSITTGNIVEFIIYVNMLTWPVTSIGWIASVVQEAEASQQRINEVMESKPKIVDKGSKISHFDGKIEFRNVHFTYPETGIEALNDVSFTLEAGTKMAIIGKVASGKSTIAELLMRMYDVNAGVILIDGKPIKEYNIATLREKIAYVPQDVFIFSDTIKGNIAFGLDEEPDISIVKKYAAYAAIDEEIEKLPHGYDAIVGERGVTLSGGQKQRISIARGLIKDPNLVILDDCLSAVDVETEQQILSYLTAGLKNKTAIVITHRVHSLNDFDLIIVLENGKIVEQGNHETLSSNNGYYQQMVELNIESSFAS